MTDPLDRELAVFNETRRIPAGERAAYLDQACAGDPALRQRVEELLRAGDEAGAFLQDPAPGAQRSPQPAAPEGPGRTLQMIASHSEKPGDRIGRYKLLQQIGEGGCGLVYMAEQEEPVRRRVALKVIKLGMDTKQVIARFEAERQALALMDHPNIAKVLDAGTTGTGRPYFVMELVRGIKITDYCDEHNLSTKERLELFMQVCQAIQHAHQKGIIHRDIKPSNILVTITEPGAPGCPKVIDFGIAKATTGQHLTDKTIFTAFEQFIGTPAYMSPEQAMLTSLDIDTRTDIYALGVLLYELLTGQTPFDAKDLMEAGLDAMRRIIREQEPVRPSTRLSTMLEGQLTTTAQHRHTDPPRLVHLVRGDLDWIVMKCLEKDRARRYDTANGLANDVRRHLNCEPVVARPPSKLYEFQKTVRRHKFGFAAGAAVIMVLAVGILVSTSEAFRATRAERDQARLRAQAQQAAANETEQRQQADRLRARAEDQTAQLEHQLYASHMNVAFQAWEKGDLSRVEQLLEIHRPKPGEEDLRGFEWFYLSRLCHSDQFTLGDHNAPMRCVAFSPDGRWLATAGDDSTARIWDAITGKSLRILRGHSGTVSSLAFAPDGKVLATGGTDRTIRLWDALTGEQLAILPGHKNDVTALGFGPDGKWLASADGALGTGYGNPFDKFVDSRSLVAEIKIWDIARRQAIFTLRGHSRSVLSLAVSPDGERLASGSTDNTVKIWKVATGELQTNLAIFKVPILAVAFSPDGQSLAIGGGNPERQPAELNVWDLAAGKHRLNLKIPNDTVFALAFSPDGKTLASAGLEQVVKLWDIATGDLLRTIKGHKAPIWSLAYHPNGKSIASASWDQTVKVWDAEAQQDLESVPGGISSVYSGCFSPEGKYLIRSGSKVEVFEIGKKVPRVIIPDYISYDIIVAISPDGATLASAGPDGIITLWEVGTWRRLASMRGHWGTIWSLAFSPDSRTLASGADQTVRLWDVSKKREQAVFRSRIGTPFALVFTLDGRTLIAASGEEMAFLDAITGEAQKTLHQGSRVLALSPGGRYLLLAPQRSDQPQDTPPLELMDLSTMEVKWRITPHRAIVWQACFSPDGKTLATASLDGTAKLWNAASGQEMFVYRASGVVWSVAFSPNGELWTVASGSPGQGQLALFRGAPLPQPLPATNGAAPAILVQPESRTSSDAEGSAVSFGAFSAGTPPLTYQWRKDANILPEQTNATLTLVHVTAGDAANYSVMVTNLFGRAVSSNASLTVLPIRETMIAEVNFQDKPASAGYSASAWTEARLALTNSLKEVPGAGIGGAAGLVMRADRSAFKRPRGGWASFGANVGALANSSSGVNSTNLDLYKLYATIKTLGITGPNSHGRIQWKFSTAIRDILTVEFDALFTTNYQTYFFILSDGRTFRHSVEEVGGSLSEFAANLDQITKVSCTVVADQWMGEYGPDADNGFCISDIKFVRLVPIAPTSVGLTERSVRK